MGKRTFHPAWTLSKAKPASLPSCLPFPPQISVFTSPAPLKYVLFFTFFLFVVCLFVCLFVCLLVGWLVGWLFAVLTRTIILILLFLRLRIQGAMKIFTHSNTCRVWPSRKKRRRERVKQGTKIPN